MATNRPNLPSWPIWWKSRIRETPNLLGDADSSTAAKKLKSLFLYDNPLKLPTPPSEASPTSPWMGLGQDQRQEDVLALTVDFLLFYFCCLCWPRRNCCRGFNGIAVHLLQRVQQHLLVETLDGVVCHQDILLLLLHVCTSAIQISIKRTASGLEED